MEKKKCFIHYPQLALKNENKLIDVSENSFETIHRAKSARIELGDKHFHKIQCESVPNEYREGLCYHYECYNNFTKANNRLQKKMRKKKVCLHPQHRVGLKEQKKQTMLVDFQNTVFSVRKPNFEFDKEEKTSMNILPNLNIQMQQK